MNRLLTRLLVPAADVDPVEVAYGSALAGLGALLLAGRQFPVCQSLSGPLWGPAFALAGALILVTWWRGVPKWRALATFWGGMLSWYAAWSIILVWGLSAPAWLMLVQGATLCWAYFRLAGTNKAAR